MSTIVEEVLENINEEFSDCIKDCRNGDLPPSIRGFVINGMVKILDTWEPKLKTAERMEILDAIQEIYGICL